MEEGDSSKFKIRMILFLVLYIIVLANLFLGFPAERRPVHYANLIVLLVIPITAGIVISIQFYKRFLADNGLIPKHKKDKAIGLFSLIIGTFFYYLTVANLKTNYIWIDRRPDLNPEAYIIYYEVFRFVAICIILISLTFLYDGYRMRERKDEIMARVKENPYRTIQLVFLVIIVTYPFFSTIFLPFFKESYYGLFYMTFFGYPILIAMIYGRETKDQMYERLTFMFSLFVFILWIDLISESYLILAIFSDFLFYLLIFGTIIFAPISSLILLFLKKKGKITIKPYESALAIVFTLLSFLPLLLAMSMGT